MSFNTLEELFENLDILMQNADKCIQFNKINILKINCAIELLHMKRDQALKNICLVCEQLIGLIKDYQGMFSSDILNFFTIKHKSLQELKNKLQMLTKRLENDTRCVKKMLTMGTEETVLVNYGSLWDKISSTISICNVKIDSFYILEFLPSQILYSLIFKEKFGFIRCSNLLPKDLVLSAGSAYIVDETVTIDVIFHKTWEPAVLDFITYAVYLPDGKKGIIHWFFDIDKNHSLSFTPQTAGKYLVSVKLYEQDVEHSPISIFVTDKKKFYAQNID